jgi:hypothetical protein
MPNAEPTQASTHHNDPYEMGCPLADHPNLHAWLQRTESLARAERRVIDQIGAVPAVSRASERSSVSMNLAQSDNLGFRARRPRG